MSGVRKKTLEWLVWFGKIEAVELILRNLTGKNRAFQHPKTMENHQFIAGYITENINEVYISMDMLSCSSSQRTLVYQRVIFSKCPVLREFLKHHFLLEIEKKPLQSLVF